MRRLLVVALAVMTGACTGSPDDGGATPAAAAAVVVGPVIEIPAEEPPADLQIDPPLVEGTGPTAQPGDRLVVRFVGRAWESGRTIGAWDAPPFGFRLGAGEVIAGWDEGLQAMTVGERRRIVVPPELAYGDPAGETLVFVVELLAIEP